MKKILNTLKTKSNKFSFKKFLVLFGAAFIINLFSKVLGGILFITAGLYLVGKGCIPVAKKIYSKFKTLIKQKYIKSRKTKNAKFRKNLTLFKSKKKETKQEKLKNIKNNKKSIPNVIKNFKLLSTNKFNLNLKVKRDINGCKIVNGSYRITEKEIIDNKTYFSYPNKMQEQEYSQKMYVKTK